VAEVDLETASQSTPMFGLLATLRYLFNDIDFAGSKGTLREEWREIIVSALSLATRVIQIVKAPLSHQSPEGNFSTADGEDGDDDDGNEEGGGEGDESLGPSHQVQNSCCWRSIKEASLVLVSLVLKIPCTPISSTDDQHVSTRIFLFLFEVLIIVCSVADNGRSHGHWRALFKLAVPTSPPRGHFGMCIVISKWMNF